VDTTLSSDVDGMVEIPGMEECVECYEVTVTKEGYTTDRTYGTDEVAIPAKPDVTVLGGQVTETAFVIDTVTSLKLVTVKGPTWGYQRYGNIGLMVRGTKEIGRDVLDQPVYKVDQTVYTNSNGEFTLSNLEWDAYRVDLVPGSLLDMGGMWPINPFAVVPTAQRTFTMVLRNASDHSILVAVKDNSGAPLGGVTVNLSNASESFNQQKVTAAVNFPDQGQADFSNLPETLEPYTVDLSLEGYELVSTQATVSGDIVEQLIMNPVEP
jgi:hypothetical protein